MDQNQTYDFRFGANLCFHKILNGLIRYSPRKHEGEQQNLGEFWELIEELVAKHQLSKTRGTLLNGTCARHF